MALKFCYSIYWPRDAQWYQVTWREMSTWCNEQYGSGNWEYFGERFCFMNETDKMIFKLRFK